LVQKACTFSLLALAASLDLHELKNLHSGADKYHQISSHQSSQKSATLRVWGPNPRLYL
jgi:hypothetical protein